MFLQVPSSQVPLTLIKSSVHLNVFKELETIKRIVVPNTYVKTTNDRFIFIEDNNDKLRVPLTSPPFLIFAAIKRREQT